MDIPTLFPPSRQQLSSYRQLVRAGLTSHFLKAAILEGELVRVRRAVYSPVPLPKRVPFLMTDGVLCPGYLAEVRAVLLELGPRAMAGGRTAALLWGWDLAVEPTCVEVVVPPGGITKRLGVVFTQLADPHPLPSRAGGFDPVPTLQPVETVVQCALTLPLSEAVVIADSAMRKGTVSRKSLSKAVRKHHAKPGYRRLRKVLLWSDERSGSVLESLFRVLVLSAGIVRPRSQFLIAKGASAMRVDFCWEDLRLVVECDGRRFHDPDDARNTDRRRDNALESLSWRVLRFTWSDVVHNPAYVLELVKECLAGWRAAA
jgi:very-short-patch-repair endonuclease